MANDVFEVLAEDHRRVEGILTALEETSEHGERMELLNDLTLELIPHARAEERLLYPRIKEHDRGREIEDTAEEEHAMAEELLGELHAMSEGEAGFSEKVGQLKNAIQQHVKMEESDLFSIGRELFNEEQAANLAVKIDDVKQEVQATIEQVAAGGAFPEARGAEGSAASPS